MTDSNLPSVFENVPSPFSGTAVDDLKIAVQGLQVKVLEGGAENTIPLLEMPVTDTQPRVRGEPASLEAAVAAAANILASSRLPLFSGFGTDVDGTRAALSLIDRAGGVFDQMRAEGGLRNLLVLQDSGWVATTFAELKNRVEVLVVVATDVESQFARFFERFVWPRETLFGEDASRREIICLGAPQSGTAAMAPDGRAPTVIPFATERLPEVAAALAALARGAKLQAEAVAGVPVADLEALLARLRAARYSVFTWAAGQLAFPHAELAVQQICQVVNRLNAETRSAILPLGGQEGDRTAGQVCTWLTGYPTRVSFARGFPEYDPYHFSTARLLADGQADALVWVANLSATPPPVTALPTVVIGRSGMTFEREPEVFIPVGVPGIDHAGHMYRCDNVVAMPLYQLRESGLPTAAEVLRQIDGALPRESKTCGHPSKAKSFKYLGTVDCGVTILYPNAGPVNVPAAVFARIRYDLRGQSLAGGFDMQDAPAGGFGAWLNQTFPEYSPRHGSHIAAIMRDAGWVKCTVENTPGNPVCLSFPPWQSAQGS
jgi:formylmethanofuran dehydrogenase subunit B